MLDNFNLIFLLFSDLFSNLLDQHPDKCAAHLDVVMTKVVSLILGLAAIPTFGKKAAKYVFDRTFKKGISFLHFY